MFKPFYTEITCFIITMIWFIIRKCKIRRYCTTHLTEKTHNDKKFQLYIFLIIKHSWYIFNQSLISTFSIHKNNKKKLRRNIS